MQWHWFIHFIHSVKSDYEWWWYRCSCFSFCLSTLFFLQFIHWFRYDAPFCLYFLLIRCSHSTLQVPNQLVGAPLLTDVTLICNVEASPKAINYWQRENGKIMNRKIFNFSFTSFFMLASFFIKLDFSVCFQFNLISICFGLKINFRLIK